MHGHAERRQWRIDAGLDPRARAMQADPLENIRDSIRVQRVIKNGELFTLEQLLEVPGR